MLRPKESADGLGVVDKGSGGGLRSGSFEFLREGSCGGILGVAGISISLVVTSDGFDFVAFNGTLVLISFDCVRLGGNGGNVPSPQAGAAIILRPLSADCFLEYTAAFEGPRESADIDDTFDMTEAFDSLESRLTICSDGLLGGNAGAGPDDFLDGRGGGALFFCFSPVRVMTGGGSTSC